MGKLLDELAFIAFKSKHAPLSDLRVSANFFDVLYAVRLIPEHSFSPVEWNVTACYILNLSFIPAHVQSYRSFLMEQLFKKCKIHSKSLFYA